MNVKLHLYFYECKECGKKFKSPHLSGDGYGEFLMRNKNNNIVYINAFEDSVFDEVKIKFRRIMTIFSQVNKLNESDLFQTVFCVACDKVTGTDETAYCIMQGPTCPYCGQENIRCWGSTEPPEYIKQDVKLVTHEHWNTLTEQQKYEAVYQAIADYFQNN